MPPLLILALLGGAAYYLMNKDGSKELQQTGAAGGSIDPRLHAIPGFYSLPADHQQQLNWLVTSGSKAQLLESAAFFEKAGNAYLGGLLRSIAATRS